MEYRKLLLQNTVEYCDEYMFKYTQISWKNKLAPNSYCVK